MNFFKELSTKTSFPVCLNLLPHYAAEGQNPDTLMDCVKEALQDGRVSSFFLSAHPSQPQKTSTLQLAEGILAAGGEPIISLALNIDHRKAVREKLQQYCRAGVRHFLFVSGDYPAASYDRHQEPVFDVDSVQMLMLLDELGFSKNPESFTESRSDHPADEASIIKGCAVSPFKKLESEQVWQYEKLKRKIAVGADFIITQPGFDLRKFDELLRFCSLQNITVPLVANIFVAGSQAAQFIQSHNIPGVKIPDRLLQTLVEEEAPNAPEGTNTTRTAKTLAVLKGLGYNGALIGGISSGFSKVAKILDEAEKAHSDWQNFPLELDYSGSSFYYFQKDPGSGLNTNQISPVKSKHFPSPLYSFSYFIDAMIYLPKGPFFKMTGRICHFCNGRRFWYSSIWLLEFLTKGILYGCKMCGDCVLYACGFRCYQSECPKKMANGPCGGSTNGYCEVFPDKKLCFWVRVYKQLKGISQNITFKTKPIPPRNNKLYKTSSWINFFLGRDHRKMHFEDN